MVLDFIRTSYSGPKGDPGLPGLDGLQGRPGDSGRKGEKGGRGEKGERGSDGKDGRGGSRGHRLPGFYFNISVFQFQNFSIKQIFKIGSGRVSFALHVRGALNSLKLNQSFSKNY